MRFKSKKDDMLVREVGDETVIYDRSSDKFLRLNAAASIAWRHCQEEKTLHQLAICIGEELGVPADETVAELAVQELLREGLLVNIEDNYQVTPGITRRAGMQHFAAGTAASMVLPLVVSMVAPNPAAAQSY
jgi:hypothetical protein